MLWAMIRRAPTASAALTRLRVPSERMRALRVMAIVGDGELASAERSVS